MNKMNLNLELNITEFCNMRCTYCFEDNHFTKKKMTINEAEKLCKRLIELQNTEKFKKLYNGIDITFWGGEPTTNIKVLNYIYTTLNNTNSTFFLYTNGLNIKKIENLIKNDNFNFQISYDGKPLHDKNRLNINGVSTTNTIIENFKWLIERDIKFEIKSTITPTDFSFLEECWKDIEHLNETYFKSFKLTYCPTIDYHNEYDINIDIFENQLKKITLLEYKYNKKHNTFLSTWFLSDCGKRCGAGQTYFTINMNGDIFNCHGFLYIKNKMKELNIFDDNILDFLKDRLENSIYKVHPKCKKCFVTICNMCNVKFFEKSKKVGYNDKWNDIETSKWDMCKYYKIITKYKMGLIELINKKLRINKNGIYL